ncbi:MAG: hypothetical protein HGB05_12405, partial [Chloroflexi bacterium]|nr:hypothetical protein [Chloroflexota bacterium]
MLGATRVARYPASVLRADNRPEETIFLGIDRMTFPNVAYWQSNFAPARLGSLMNVLAQYPNGVLIDREFAEEQRLKLGDSFSMAVQGESWSANLPVVIVGIVDLFPSWYPEKGPLIVGNNAYLAQQAGTEEAPMLEAVTELERVFGNVTTMITQLRSANVRLRGLATEILA